jgi:two-component system cell cycle response regulator DivK
MISRHAMKTSLWRSLQTLGGRSLVAVDILETSHGIEAGTVRAMPAFMSSAPPQPAAKGSETRFLHGRSALIVEDDPLSAKLAAVLLLDAGCKVVIAPNATDALGVLAVFQPSVIVLDLILPRMSGLLLAERIKATPKTRDAIIVAVSSMGGVETEQVVSKTGCAAFVRKPIDVLTFAQTVANCLGENR